MAPFKEGLSRMAASRSAPFGTLLLLVLAAVLPYLNTFSVPWYFDDVNNIVDNPLIRDLPRAARGLFMSRGVALFTFALNHRFGGLAPAGYHFVNLAIHAGCVVAVWLLLRRLLASSVAWPLFGALLFALHPVQTQAVTYIVQRMTSMSALFFLLAVYGYLRSLDDSGRRRGWLYAWSLGCGALAVLTKENAAVLPLLLLLVERYFRPGRPWRQQLLSLLPFCLAPAWKAAEMLLLPLWRGDVAASIHYADQLQSLQNVTPLRYLVTEFSVIWYYFKLLLFPLGQTFDYGWPVVEELLTVQSLAALAGILGLWAFAWFLRRRWPLTSFGIAWFFITLSVESSLIPLDPLFEHRLYLPFFGFVLVAIDLLRRLPWPRWRVPLCVAILLPLAVLTWQRNALWGDQVAFFEENLRHSPENVRVMVMLGNAYAAQKRPDDGLRMIERAMQRNARYDFAYTAQGKILIDLGRGAEAIPFLLQGLQYYPQSVVLNEYLGVAYGEAGNFPQALKSLQRAALLNPEDASVYTNLGVVASRLGEDRQAADYFRRALKLAPDSEKTWFNYASTLFVLGKKPEVLDALRAVVKLNPDNADAQYGLGTLALAAGSRQEAAATAAALHRLGDERALELDTLLQQANP
jgi:protein O-mannosyl-transferase